MNWTRFASEAPELAEKTGLILLDTITADGTPRISLLEDGAAPRAYLD